MQLLRKMVGHAVRLNVNTASDELNPRFVPLGGDLVLDSETYASGWFQEFRSGNLKAKQCEN